MGLLGGLFVILQYQHRLIAPWLLTTPAIMALVLLLWVIVTGVHGYRIEFAERERSVAVTTVVFGWPIRRAVYGFGDVKALTTEQDAEGGNLIGLEFFDGARFRFPSRPEGDEIEVRKRLACMVGHEYGAS